MGRRRSGAHAQDEGHGAESSAVSPVGVVDGDAGRSGTAVEPRQVTLARLEAVCADPQTADVLCARVAEGESVREIARSWAVPAGLLLRWLMDDEARWRAYKRAKELDAYRMVEEAVAIADGAGDVKRDTLRVNTRFRVAAAHARETYGASEREGQRTQVNVVVQRQVPTEPVSEESP